MSHICVASTTVGSAEQAQAIARESVALRLAACAQVEPIQSFYVWEGRACDEPEWRVVFKTAPGRAAALRDWLLGGRHPYSLPQWLERDERASAAYARWVNTQCVTSPPGHSGARPA